MPHQIEEGVFKGHISTICLVSFASIKEYENNKVLFMKIDVNTKDVGFEVSITEKGKTTSVVFNSIEYAIKCYNDN